MAKRKPAKKKTGKRPVGRPKEHKAGFTRSTLIFPLDLLAELDVVLAGWIVKKGTVTKRSELCRAFFRAVVAADQAGKLEDLAVERDEDAMSTILTKRLMRK